MRDDMTMAAVFATIAGDVPDAIPIDMRIATDTCPTSGQILLIYGLGDTPTSDEIFEKVINHECIK